MDCVGLREHRAGGSDAVEGRDLKRSSELAQVSKFHFVYHIVKAFRAPHLDSILCVWAWLRQGRVP